jgi:predicted esterase
LFGEVSGGSYGSASQYNMSKRYAFGISSGGYNSSRMAVTFNGSSNFKALGVVSASYATCSGSICSVPTLPSNHPPTKFWHGTADTTVPISTMRTYYNKLVSQGIPTAKVEHSYGHQFTADDLGSTGVKAWFDAH